ncbi:hypothetical protein [Oerskovia flava]|uniref:hypothetical protein n=1 Tax=Oerskovia flava TaxID=2986422 RepID=UPI002240B46A|nr:hypothetical protein [Oerskovia sp. JB1-3-2]
MLTVAGPLRVTRAVLLATLVLALAALAHHVAGGVLPHPAILAALTAFTVAGTTAVSSVRFTAPRLLVVLGAGQLLLHQALTLLAAPGTGVARSCVPASAALPPAALGHAGHGACGTGAGVGTVPTGSVVPALPETAAHLAHSTPSDLWMLGAHVVATVVLALVVARGEEALARLIVWLVPLARVVVPVAPAPSRRLQPASPAPAPRRALHVVGVAPTRGPPSGGRPVTA